MTFPSDLKKIPSLVGTPAKWDMTASACCGIDEYLSVRNDMFFEGGYTDTLKEATFRFAVTVAVHHPQLRDGLVQCIPEKFRTAFVNIDFEEEKAKMQLTDPMFW